MKQFVRFALMGGLNTLLTYGVYAILVGVLPYTVSYTVAYLLGIGLSYYLNARFVFRAPLRVGTAATYPLVYLVQYLVGVALLRLLVEALRVSELIAPLVVIALTLPLIFALSRLVLRGPAAHTPPRPEVRP
jgi:putative flippase GtrA